MFLYGYHTVREALRHRPHEIARVLVSAARAGRRREEIAEACRRHRVPFEVVPERALAEIAGPAHNGMAAEVRAGAALPAAGGDSDLVVLLEDVQDPRNLGAVLRVCEGAGAGRVMIRDRTKSVAEEVNSVHEGDAAFANYVWMAGYTLRIPGRKSVDAAAALKAPAAGSTAAAEFKPFALKTITAPKARCSGAL